MKEKLNLYLTRAKELGIIPNFFMSMPYFLLSGVQAVIENGWIWVEDGGQFVCPPLPLKLPMGQLSNMKIWASFPKSSSSLGYFLGYDKELLDNQYIFDPADFTNMVGGKWETFRKNVKKIHKNFTGKRITYEPCGNSSPLLIDWLEKLGDKAEDAGFLAEFAFLSKNKGIHRKYLYFDNECVAVNAWDENYKFINYRICIVNSSIPFLSEYARWCFYTDPEIILSAKLVNDGGNLGNPNLAKFKEKMNPKEIQNIYTLTPKNYEQIRIAESLRNR